MKLLHTTNWHNDSEIKALSDKLKLCITDDSQFYINPDIIQKNNQWYASILLSEIIFSAKKESKFTYNNLLSFQNKYQRKYKVQIPIESFIEKQWIRIINDEVRLPNEITRALYYFREKKKNNQPKFPLFINENIKDFQFLHELHTIIGYKDKRKIIISKNKLERIVKKHRSYFKRTPDFEQLLRELNITAIDNKRFTIRITCGYDNFWHHFSDEISARLWERLLTEYPQKTIDENFEEWFEKCLWTKNPCTKMDKDAREKLLTTACNKLVSEKDLIYSEYELAKLYLDRHQNHHHWNEDIILPQRHKINSNSYLELYTSLNELERQFDSILFHQEIREDFSFLIKLIIENDAGNFQQTKKLFKISLERPFIFYKLLQKINKNHPFILPYLITENELFPVIFDCLSRLKICDTSFNEDDNSKGRFYEKQITILLKKSLSIYLFNALQQDINYDQIANNIINILHPNLKKIFSPINISHYNLSILEKEEHIYRFEELLNNIVNFKSNLEINFFEKIYPKLLHHIDKEIIRPLSTNVTMHGLYLSKYFIIYKLFKDEKLTTDKQKDLILLLVNSFKSEIESDKVEVQHYWHGTIDINDVSWSDTQYGLELIDWGELILYIEQFSLLNDFLNSFKVNIITLNNKNKKEFENIYHWNHSQGYKLRLLLRILLIGYSNIHKKKTYYENCGLNTNQVLQVLEYKIVKYVSENSQQNTEKAKFDIFSHSFDSTLGIQTDLFSQLGETMNYFTKENKEIIINSFIKSDNSFEKFMELYNLLFFERDRQLLKEKLELIPVKEYIKKAYWLPQLENALIQAINSETFTEQAKEILDYYERIINNKIKNQRQKNDFLLQIRLLLAYRNNSRDELNNITIPEKSNDSLKSGYNPHNQKIFYESLFDFKERKLEDALKKLERLCNSEPNNTEFFIRKCYIESLVIDNLLTTDLKKAIAECQSLQQRINKKSFDENQYYNKLLLDFIRLYCYSILDNNSSNFQNLFSQLPLTQKMDQEYLELSIKSFIKWEEYNKAMLLIEESKRFHILKNSTYPEFLNDLTKNLGSDNNINRLKSYLWEILLLPFEDLAQIIPKKFNKSNGDYREFIAYEMVIAFSHILEKINTITKLNNENSYSDFLEILINNGLKFWGCKFNPQDRSGHSETGKNIGSLDLKMSLGNKNITVEALRWNSNNFLTGLKKHIKKTFNYDPSRSAFYNIIYYENSDFHNDWEKLKNTFFTQLKFPNEYKCNDTITEINDLGNNSIKVAISKHNHNLFFYHIMVNINYKISQ